MKKILIVGAGRSSANLIKYLLDHADACDWHIRVGDMDEQFARQEDQRRKEIAEADLVISMLPAAMHMEVAKDCLHFGKHIITPSYIPDEMWDLHQLAIDKGIVMLNEMGVDPGIDHMSAMKIIDDLKSKGATLQSFESFTGGLIAPESDDNPWHYKITWNPRNVILAGYGGTARYRENNTLKFIPYHRLFERITPVDLGEDGFYEGYANRDSLKYLKLYDIENIPTLYRGTLRKLGYCTSWNLLVQLGLTDDSFSIPNASSLTWQDLTASLLPESSTGTLSERVQSYLNASAGDMQRLEWLGIFEDQPLGIESGSPALALQKLVEARWKLNQGDKDMIVMWHRFFYSLNGKRYQMQSTLITTGDDPMHTAMSKTVGLPIAIAAKYILTGQWNLKGVCLPTTQNIYLPVLQELASLGIQFKETVQESA